MLVHVKVTLARGANTGCRTKVCGSSCVMLASAAVREGSWFQSTSSIYADR